LKRNILILFFYSKKEMPRILEISPYAGLEFISFRNNRYKLNSLIKIKLSIIFIYYI